MKPIYMFRNNGVLDGKRIYDAPTRIGSNEAEAFVPLAEADAFVEEASSARDKLALQLADAEQRALVAEAEAQRLQVALSIRGKPLPPYPADLLPRIGEAVEMRHATESAEDDSDRWGEVIVAGYALVKQTNPGAGRRAQRLLVRGFDANGRVVSRDLEEVRRRAVAS